VLALVAPGAVVEPEEAGAEGVAAGVAEEPGVVVSDEAGVVVFSEPGAVVFSEPGAAAFSGESPPEPGFILSE
jgi:hypothetical protein